MDWTSSVVVNWTSGVVWNLDVIKEWAGPPVGQAEMGWAKKAQALFGLKMQAQSPLFCGWAGPGQAVVFGCFCQVYWDVLSFSITLLNGSSYT